MNSTTVLVIATLEANMNDIMELAKQDHDRVFNLTDALKKPLGQRLAEHIKNLLLGTGWRKKVAFFTFFSKKRGK